MSSQLYRDEGAGQGTPPSGGVSRPSTGTVPGQAGQRVPPGDANRSIPGTPTRARVRAKCQERMTARPRADDLLDEIRRASKPARLVVMTDRGPVDGGIDMDETVRRIRFLLGVVGGRA